jgi:hypothetical protein
MKLFKRGAVSSTAASAHRNENRRRLFAKAFPAGVAKKEVRPEL